MNIKDQKIIDFVEEVASKSPTPGGGAVAAVSGAMAAALIEMVANLTIGKKDYEKVSGTMAKILRESSKIKNNLLALADQDTAAYDRVMKAYKISKENKSRFSQIQKALANATEVPLKTAQLSKEIWDLSKLAVKHGNKNAYSDAKSAQYLAQAALRSALENVKINLKFINDQKFKQQIQSQISILTKV